MIIVEKSESIADVPQVKQNIAFWVLLLVENLAGKIFFLSFAEHRGNQVFVVLLLNGVKAE